MHMKEDVVMMSKWRNLLACTLGVSLATIFGFSFYILVVILNQEGIYTFTSSKTGIAVEKLILLRHFLFMPWPVANLRRVDYFKRINYPAELSGDLVPFLIFFHSLYFLFGALLAVGLSGAPRQSEVDLQRKEKSLSLPGLLFTLKRFPPPWLLYTLLMLGIRLTLIGAATTYYTGPGGPAWVYPAPIFLIPFAFWVGGISFLVQSLCGENKLEKGQTSYYILISLIIFYFAFYLYFLILDIFS